MDDKKKRSFGIRVLGSLSTFALLGIVIYMFVAGVDIVSSLLLVAALGGLAGPAVASGDGIAECITGILEAFVEGIQGIFEGIAEIISSIFS